MCPGTWASSWRSGEPGRKDTKPRERSSWRGSPVHYAIPASHSPPGKSATSGAARIPPIHVADPAADLVFIDTNVLVYLRDSTESGKQAAAAEWMARLWDTGRGRLSVQVLQEYYVTVTAKLDPGLPAVDAREDVVALRSWRPLEASLELLENAWSAQDRYGFSFWDALIVAAARRLGCGVLLTEDLQDGQELDGLVVRSPFIHAPS